MIQNRYKITCETANDGS
jgi:CheY-like chemotaxis protein